MTANEKTHTVRRRITQGTGVALTFADAETLRRAGMTLHRWAEWECGGGNAVASWLIERDETTGAPYRVLFYHTGAPRRYRIPDRERGALTRVRDVCARNGLHYWHQTDPRGCALYVGAEPLTDVNYSSRGVAVSAS